VTAFVYPDRVQTRLNREKPLATTSPSSVSGHPEISYDLFLHEAGTAIVLKYSDRGVRLRGHRIAWSVGSQDKELPLSDIAAIHLTTEVNSLTTQLGATMCRIIFKNGVALSVFSTNSLGLDDAGFAARYREFVADLHARLSPTERASIVLSAGRGGVMYGFTLLVAILFGAGVIAIVVFSLALGTFTPRVLIGLILGTGLVVAMFRFLQVNAPHAYDPARPLDSASSGSIIGTIDHALTQFRRGMTPAKGVAYGAAGLAVVGIGVVIVGSRGTVNLFEPGRARHAFEQILSRAGSPLVVKSVEVTAQIMTVVVPDPGGSSAPTVWTASRHSLFGWTDWDDVTGPTKRYDTALSDDVSQEPFKVAPSDVAGLDSLVKAAIVRTALGSDSVVTRMILTQAPQFIHPEQPRWTVRVAGPSRSAEVFADRTGMLFPAPAPRVGPPRIVIYVTSDAWIRVRDADQSILFDDVLHPGAGYAVPNAPGLTLRTGKAGALEIAVDGKTAPSIGDGFMARRDVLLDPDALLAGTAVEQ
jgi:hypothetical protein